LEFLGTSNSRRFSGSNKDLEILLLLREDSMPLSIYD
jgi:hypothetical protein